MTIKLTLDEKYHDLVKDTMRDEIIHDVDYIYLVTKHKKLIDELAHLWFNTTTLSSDECRVIERIHSADEIEGIEHKYYWRLKTNKVHNNYMCPDAEGVFFTDEEGYRFTSPMTESEFKKLLDGTGLPFDAFERVEVNEED